MCPSYNYLTNGIFQASKIAIFLFVLVHNIFLKVPNNFLICQLSATHSHHHERQNFYAHIAIIIYNRS